ncbi:D,D-heptose 1,7-bisphosphate phosphatase [Salmonella enterica subsp. enterica serovar Virchow]|nr:D,D-heptose 1,7-bisphosphate phosphatase [Salmonella enterica subsp. enterica serovar Virchow]
MTPGAGALIAAVNAMGWPVVMVSNQAGVGRGYYDWSDFRDVQAEIHRQLAGFGAAIDAVFACGYHEKGRAPLDVPDHVWRKPNPGMLMAAAEMLDLDMAGSWIVGDRASDLAAGRSAGLCGGALVATGYGAEMQEIAGAEALGGAGFAVRRIENLAAFDLDWTKARRPAAAGC